ncbi:hypothetical protein COBT_002989 [Conglomerata obtusa]
MSEDIPYPSLFLHKKHESVSKPIIQTSSIPTSTLHETVIPVKKEETDFVVLFGMNYMRLKDVPEAKKGNVIETGHNWIKVTFDDELKFVQCLCNDRKMINGEIIGCYRNVEKISEKIAECKKGFFTRIKEYFFG